MSTNDSGGRLPGRVRGGRLPDRDQPPHPRDKSLSHLWSWQKHRRNPLVPPGWYDDRPNNLGGYYREIQRLHVVNHAYMSPAYWPGQIVAVFSEGVMENTHVVRCDGQEFICYLFRDSQHPGLWQLTFDFNCKEYVLVDPASEDFEDYGTVMGGLSTCDHEARSLFFWPSFHTVAN